MNFIRWRLSILAWVITFPAWAEPSSDFAADDRNASDVEWPTRAKPSARLAQSLSDNSLLMTQMSEQEPARDWSIALSDHTFYQTLLRWSRVAKWQLVWEADRDFLIDAEVTLHGSFIQALDQSMRALRETDYPIRVYVNPSTKVVRVTRYLLDGERQ